MTPNSDAHTAKAVIAELGREPGLPRSPLNHLQCLAGTQRPVGEPAMIVESPEEGSVHLAGSIVSRRY